MRPDELDALYADRPDTPALQIVDDLLVSDAPASVKVIFCGARGSGKSTELTRVGAQLQRDFAVVQVDIFQALREGQGTAAVLTMLGVAGLRAAQVWSAPDADLEWPPPALADVSAQLSQAIAGLGGVADGLAEWVTGATAVVTLFAPDVAATGAALGAAAKGAGQLSAAMSRALNRLSEIGSGALSRALGSEQDGHARALVSAVQAIFDRVGELAGRPALLLVDGLDQLSSLDEVRAAVSDAHLLQQLKVPQVFTGPIQLRHHHEFNGLPGRFRPAVLHNLSVVSHGEGQVVRGAGVRVLEAAYRRRVEHLDLPEALVAEAALQELAQASSGIVREFFVLLYEACRSAMRSGRERLNADDVSFALRERRLFHELSLNDQKLRILWRVLSEERMFGAAEGEELLFANLIACYRNDHLWYRPNELLVEYVAKHGPSDAA